MAKKRRNIRNIKKPVFNDIKITKHAIDQYRERIDENATEEYINNFYNKAVSNGQITSCRDSLLDAGKGKIEVRFIYNGIGILGIFQNNTLSIITCTGDKRQRGWYRQENMVKPYRRYLS